MKSIIQDTKECYICKNLYDFENTSNLNDHHIFFGTANRAKSEQYGLKVWLCVEHHTASEWAVHQCRERDIYLKKIAQRKFEESHTREEFIKNFGKSFILD